MVKQLLILICLIFSSIHLFSQDELKVQLKDSETNKPISYATIRFKGTSRGLIADYDGQFRVPIISLDLIPNLLITSLGYKSIDVNPNDFDLNEITTIKMIPKVESLKTVVLNAYKKNRDQGKELEKVFRKGKKMLAKEIVVKAIKNIPDNLDDNYHSSIGYYRDYQLIRNEYFNLNEGILEEYDIGIKKKSFLEEPIKHVFYSFNQNPDFKINKDYAIKYDGINKFIQNAQINGFGGNELSILNIHNPIRNYDTNTFSYVYQFNKDFVNIHSFFKSNQYFVGDDPVIDITFKTNKRAQFYQPQIFNKPNFADTRNNTDGKITISLKDFSIYKLEYTLYDNIDVTPLFNVKIEYRKVEDKMYLNYISFNNRFIIEDDKNTFRETSVFYNRGIGAFDIRFNKEIDKTTIKKKNFNVKFNGKPVKIRGVRVWNSRIALVYIVPPVFDEHATDVYDKDMKGFDFKMKRILDINGDKIYKKTRVVAYQFREFFVQEVFQNKSINENLKTVLQTVPLEMSPVNELINTKPYIINSPLENRRMDVDSEN